MKIKVCSEAVYIISLLLLSVAVAMISCTGYGVSMIVAPAYILSLRFPELFTFGQAEYVVQGILMILFCIAVKRLKPIYLTSFLTCIIYGAVLDLWRAVVPLFNPNITEPGSLPVYIELSLFVLGTLLTTFAIAMVFRTYFYPQVYDFIVKGICEHYNLNRDKFKVIYDFSFLVLSVILTFAFFGAIRGIGLGTLAVTAVNGALIAFFGRILDKYFEIKPAFPSFAKKFDID